ncbi:penicillin-binding protein, partial [Streptomyces sp. BE282]|nr:penicillin-binding protein [Streptomyces sp. BE282]
NELESEKGSWDMTSALGKSINTYFALLEQKAGLCETVEMEKKVGYERGDGKKIVEAPSITLGSEVSTPLSMAGAIYACATRVKYGDPFAIAKSTEPNDKKGGVADPHYDDAVSE